MPRARRQRCYLRKRVADMNQTLSRGKNLKKSILLSVHSLPPMPQVMHKAREIISNPGSSLKEVADLIETDQSLAIKVLRLSNSAYYSRMGKVSSIQGAAVVLGLKTLGELMTIAATSRLLGNSLKGYDLPAKALWHHSLAVAVGCKIIAQTTHAVPEEEAFLVGLIHDVGKLILDKYVLERKEQFSEFLADGQQTFFYAEKEILGFDHAEIAGEICEKWNFQKSTSVAVRYHHYPSRFRGNELAHIVHLADQIAIWSGIDTDEITLEIGDESAERLGIDHSKIEWIMDEVVSSVDKMTQEIEG